MFYTSDGNEYHTTWVGGVSGKEKTYYKCTQTKLHKWLREKHKLFLEIYISNDHLNKKQIFEFLILKPEGMVINHKTHGGPFNKYETAMEKGLYEALKLIKNGR